jgi:hypothetical protein
MASGRLMRIRRGIYATVPRGVKPSAIGVDPYLVASKLADDAIVAYHAAFQFFGKAYSIWRRFHYLTAKRARPFSFQSLEFVPGIGGQSQSMTSVRIQRMWHSSFYPCFTPTWRLTKKISNRGARNLRPIAAN